MTTIFCMTSDIDEVYYVLALYNYFGKFIILLTWWVCSKLLLDCVGQLRSSPQLLPVDEKKKKIVVTYNFMIGNNYYHD